MPYFKDENENLFWLDADDAEAWKKPNWIAISDEQAEDMRQAQMQVGKSYPRFFGNQKLDLFTREEQLTVVTATMTDPVVKLMYDRLIGAAYLSYEDPETEQVISMLVGKGLLTPERKAEIVSAMQPK